MSRLTDADRLLEIMEERTKPEFGSDGSKDRYRYMQWVADYHAIKSAPTVDAVEVVRCRECRWYDPPHILHNDGTRTDVEDDAPMVTADVGINCGGQCIWHIGLKTYCLNHDREDPEDTPNIVMFRKPQDFCSYGERSNDVSL